MEQLISSPHSSGKDVEIKKRPKISYKTCFVPLCKNSSAKNPSKIFFTVPKNMEIRKKWFAVAHRKDQDQPTNSTISCCEDHFDLEFDMENYLRFKMFGGYKFLRPGVLPHKFACQPNRISMSKVLDRPALKKINRKREIEDILSEDRIKNKPSPLKENSSENVKNLNVSTVKSVQTVTSLKDIEMTRDSLENVENVGCELLKFGEGMGFSAHVEKMKNMTNVGVQVKVRSHYRSKSVMCKPLCSDFMCNVKPETVDVACSTRSISFSSSTQSSKTSNNTNNFSVSGKSDSSFVPSSGGSKSNFSDELLEENMKNTALKVTLNFISTQPKQYIGVMPGCEWIVDLLQKSTGLIKNHILITLMKIKLNDSHERLAQQFGLSVPQISKIFRKSVPMIAHFLKTLILVPTKSEVKKNLPLPFRAFYSDIYGIVDAFEIQIKKSADPVSQSATWSEYKKGNTIKYIVLCTPDGTIVFVSKGYGGRVSDVTLFEDSKVMDVLPKNIKIMTDRGFKNIDTYLNSKGAELVRPPSVFESDQPSKEEVIETKRIASLRIHVERVISRIREYALLKPHATVDLAYLNLLDDMVIIAFSLINLQSPIIKM